MKRIFNEEKTKELNIDEIDLKRGYLQDSLKSIFIEEQKAIPEEGHYETLAEYPETGGKDIEWIVDKPGQEYIPAHEEEEEIQIYISYTDDQLKVLGLYEWSEEELRQQREIDWNKKKVEKIIEIKDQLKDSDYHILKYIEGLISEEEFNFWKVERQRMRDRINEIQSYTFENNENDL